MAKSPKGAGNLMVPMAVVAVGVVVLLVITFSFSGEEVPDEATIVAEDDVDARPAGAGTVPEGEADEELEGIADQVDEVDPAAAGDQQVPAAEEGGDVATESADDATEGETSADEATAGQANTPVVQGVAGDQNEGEAGGEAAPAPNGSSGAGSDASSDTPEASSGESGDAPASSAGSAGEGGATGPSGDASGDDDAARIVPEEAEDESFLIDENSDAPPSADVDTAGEDEAESMPAGRDTQTDLTTEPGQDVVTDSDGGGAAFVPTPSGPDGREE